MALVVYVLILLLFASFCTCHVWLCCEILRKSSKKALLAFFVVPLAPYVGLHLRIPKAPTAWIVTGMGYFLMLVLALVLPGSV